MNENGIVVAFNPTNSYHVRKQIRALAEEFQLDYKIYSNSISMSLLDESAKRAYLEGYESFYILTDENLLVEAERAIKKLKLFESVISVPKYYSDGKARFTEAGEKLKLEEQGLEDLNPPTIPKMPGATPTQANVNAPIKKLLVLGIINANPMIKGHGELIKEILEKDITTYVAKYLPKFLPSWNPANTSTKIFLLPAESAAHAPIPGVIRAGLLTKGIGNIPGLYGEEGASPKKFGLDPGVFIPGVPGSTFYQVLQERAKDATNLLIFTPKDQVEAVVRLLGSQDKYNVEDNKVVRVIPLLSSAKDAPDDALVSKGIRIGEDSLWKEEKNTLKKPEEASKAVSQKKIEVPDFFTCGLITILHGISSGKINPRETSTEGVQYLQNLWAALPAGDRELLADIANNMGPGKIFSAVSDIVKAGKTLAGAVDKSKGNEAEKKKIIQDAARLQKIFQDMGYDLMKMINNSEYESFKAALDV